MSAPILVDLSVTIDGRGLAPVHHEHADHATFGARSYLAEQGERSKLAHGFGARLAAIAFIRQKSTSLSPSTASSNAGTRL